MSLELPLVLVDVQRGGPSTGLPTKTEQADLMLAMYGRHGEAPLPIVAARSASHCFDAAFEAVRLALKYRTPVILLTDGYLANGSEPWLLPDLDAMPDISVEFATAPNHTDDDGTEVFWPFLRDAETLARPWAIPGTPGLQHRIGGIEKEDGTGNVNYDPLNHEHMVKLRAEKIARIAGDIPEVDVDDPDGAELLVLTWGSTWGVAQQGVRQAREPRHERRARAPRAPQPVPEEPRRGARALRPGARARDEPRAAVTPGACRVPRRRPQPVQGAGRAVPRVGGRDRDRGARQMSEAVTLTRKDFQTDQEVRWCPGCGDYSILAAVQLLFAELGLQPENQVFISGIGCAARFPYYMNVYGLHSIHGRAPAVATGVALGATRPRRLGHRRRR